MQVPALGVSLQEDNVDLDRELVAHGISNMGAGLLGTVPNYLCYVNTVLCKSSNLASHYGIASNLGPRSLSCRRWFTAVGSDAGRCNWCHHVHRSERHCVSP